MPRASANGAHLKSPSSQRRPQQLLQRRPSHPSPASPVAATQLTQDRALHQHLPQLPLSHPSLAFPEAATLPTQDHALRHPLGLSPPLSLHQLLPLALR